MGRFRSWWQQIKQHPVITAVIIAVGILVTSLVVVVILGYWLNWTWVGVNGGYSKITTTPQGTNTEYPPGKTLWDWLELLAAFAIPIVVGFGVAWFTAQRGKASDAENKDNQRETALQEYIDKISELILKEHLRELTPDGKLKPEYGEVREIARVRTLTVLRRCDAERKATVLLFLHEFGLIDKVKSIIDLSEADLSEAYLSEANLSRAKLTSVNLSGADLEGAYLRNTDLCGADLGKANLRKAHLDGADLSDAQLSSADLSGAILFGKTILTNTNLCRATLNDADLSGANLEGASLKEANMIETYLRYANLKLADLSRANLRKAILWDADLSSAVLERADLRGAELKGAKITQKQLNQAKSLKGAILPDGTKHN